MDGYLMGVYTWDRGSEVNTEHEGEGIADVNVQEARPRIVTKELSLCYGTITDHLQPGTEEQQGNKGWWFKKKKQSQKHWTPLVIVNDQNSHVKNKTQVVIEIARE